MQRHPSTKLGLSREVVDVHKESRDVRLEKFRRTKIKRDGKWLKITHTISDGGNPKKLLRRPKRKESKGPTNKPVQVNPIKAPEEKPTNEAERRKAGAPARLRE